MRKVLRPTLPTKVAVTVAPEATGPPDAGLVRVPPVTETLQLIASLSGSVRRMVTVVFRVLQLMLMLVHVALGGLPGGGVGDGGPGTGVGSGRRVLGRISQIWHTSLPRR